jgi:PIN domain nuclease of toxin-antitoxin system
MGRGVSGFLLDTNAFSMMLSGDLRLAKDVRDTLEAADRIAVSVISFYEIGQKVRRGRWPEMAAFAADMQGRSMGYGYDIVPLSAAAAEMSSMMEWDHRDPFDRMIAAVALQERMPLVSSDPAFDKVGVERVWG